MTVTNITAKPAATAGEPEAGLLDALRRTETAVAAMRSGDPEPYIACWAEREDATLFGAWGPIEKGSRALFDTFRWVGSRYAGDRSPVKATVENTVIASSGDLAYTVGFERGTVGVDGGRKQEMVIRVTHIYRREHDAWKLIHRHADFPPPDQRQSKHH
ncbi:MAG: nuclear transport factor 2 family protein [Solirubrobacterales bacterium]|nr:nuclear transport factor 2 family protein [Solirubrobacterales bacterium]